METSPQDLFLLSSALMPYSHAVYISDELKKEKEKHPYNYMLEIGMAVKVVKTMRED